jgi:hypothetical protein
VILLALAGCAGHSTTRPGTGDEPANAGPKAVHAIPGAPDEADSKPEPASIDDKIDPAAPLPGTSVGIGTGGTMGGASGRPTAAGGAPGSSGGAGGSADPTPEEDTPQTGSGTVSVAGPQAEYVVATLVSGARANDGVSTEPGDGWLDAQSILAETVELSSPDGATTAAALVTPSGTLVDAAVSTCGSRPAASASVLGVPDEYTTIQAALDAARPGDTVAVSPGIYTEHLRLRPFVKLLGAGASVTILDGQGEGEDLIDFTDATATVVSGFTLQNVGQRDTCADTAPTDCSGDWYAAAVYADGHADACGAESSLLFTRNIVTGNDIGFLLYFHARAIVTNNVFVGNNSAFVANHHQDHSLVAQNVFYDNRSAAVIAQASYLNVIGNIMLGNGTAFSQEYVQQGFVGCNVVVDNESLGDGFTGGGYVEVDPQLVAPENLDFRLAPGSMASGLGCLGPDHDIATDPGAFGGPLGAWTPDPTSR